MNYRKRPIVIEAFQYGFDVEPDWFKEARSKGLIKYIPSRNLKKSDENKFPSDVLIRTLEGEMRADYYDFIIKGVKGELYPCKPDIFEATYEIADAVFDELATLKQRLAEACLIIERLLDRKSEESVRKAQEFIAKEGGGE